MLLRAHLWLIEKPQVLRLATLAQNDKLGRLELCSCVRMCGLLRDRRFFDCAPCGRSAQNDIVGRLELCSCGRICGLLRNRRFPSASSGQAFDSLRSLRMTSEVDQRFAFKNVFPQSALRSIHVGFSRSIRSIFFARRQPFNCVSRAMASRGEAYRSNHTKRLHLYVAVKLPVALLLCSAMRRSMLPVTPMYRTWVRLAAM